MNEKLINEKGTSQEIPKKRSKTGRFLIGLTVVIILIIVGGGGYYYLFGPCGINKVNASKDKIEDILDEFYDAYEVASSTSRIALANPVGEMQDIKRRAEDIEVPVCMDQVKSNYIKGMKKAINGFLSFMSQKSDAIVYSFFDTAASFFEKATLEMNKINECVPFCD